MSSVIFFRAAQDMIHQRRERVCVSIDSSPQWPLFTLASLSVRRGLCLTSQAGIERECTLINRLLSRQQQPTMTKTIQSAALLILQAKQTAGQCRRRRATANEHSRPSIKGLHLCVCVSLLGR